jgi:toxin-antitoxin system PIN domain toxin
VIVIDTNVLVYAANQDSEFHDACRRRIETCRQQASPWYLSWGICYEFLRVCTHPSALANPWSVAAGWRFLEIILSSPSAGLLLPTTRHAAVFAEVIAELPHLRGNVLHDAHTAVLMREHGIRDLYTRDVDFNRFPFIRALDPIAA